MTLLENLAQLASEKVIRPIDHQFARFVAARGADPLTTLAAGLTSFELGKGNVCLDLTRLEQRPADEAPLAALIASQETLPAHWAEHLVQSPLVGPDAPLRLEYNRLYLGRYHEFEQQVASRLHALSESLPSTGLSAPLARLFQRDYCFLFDAARSLQPDAGQAVQLAQKYLDLVEAAGIDWHQVSQRLCMATCASDLQPLDTLIPPAACLNWQQVAAAVAATNRFAVISGGPGTGKTTTVTKLLALLVEQAQANADPLLIRLAAPTGKAAARLTESISHAKQALRLPAEVAKQVPEQASTLHRLLGTLPGRHSFRHNRDNPLHLDVLVVDEASMVDLPMMARLLDALPQRARLILLGDRDQLASVEAGAVLGDICAFAEQGYSRERADQLGQLTGGRLAEFAQPTGAPLRDSLCLLRKSFRFDAQSGIGQLAKAVNQGDAARVDAVWSQGFEDIRHYPLSADNYRRLLSDAVTGYRPYLAAIAPVDQAEQARPILAAFGRYQLLTALRDGDLGVAGLNQAVERALRRQGLISSDSATEWYVGRPVLITSNDHGLRLYNGDIGIALADTQGRLRVYFEQSDGQIRALLPSRLPPHDTVFAMTVHKSQGSEFDRVALVLPNSPSPILTRELVYTGITRARKALELFAPKAILSHAVRHPTVRASGLAERLRRSATH